MAQDSAPILVLRNIAKRFGDRNEQLTVLSGINFSMQPGESCAVVGPSGSGKSTLLAIAAGLDTATEGEVLLDGEGLAGLDEDERAALRLRSVGFVFQSFQLIPTLTALENVSVPGELQGRQSTEAAKALLSQVGLERRLHHYPSQLSGGEQQRVALARAFVNHPRIIFADEPTGNLDRDNAARAIDLMASLHEDYGTAFLLVTHDDELASKMSRRITLRGGVMA